MTFDPGSRRELASSVLVRPPVPAGGIATTGRTRLSGDAASPFDRLIEPVPPVSSFRMLDRVIHARNAGAYGYFEARGRVGDTPASALTRAGLFQCAGTRTPVFVRFSTVAHGGHGPETVRDPRGFSIRFHTGEGRWDLVASSLPVSFVRDPTLFPSVAHAFRPEPLTHRLDPRRIFEFIRFAPSALHMLTWLFSPWGIPASYRAMRGFGAGRWTGIDGTTALVRYHVTPAAGARNLTQAEADAIQARDFNHATRDLHEAIARGECPGWEMAVQLIADRERLRLDFDPLDPTAIWPTERFPLQPVGRLVLDRNPRNYFAEVEQAVFDANAVVDGLARADDAGATGPIGRESGLHDAHARGRRMLPRRVREDHHRRAGECYRRFDATERDELVRNLVVALRECDAAVRVHMIEHFRRCDPDYGHRVADGLALVN